MDDSIYEHPQMGGVLIRAPWSALEPESGKFNFRRLQVQIDQVEAEGKPWSLAVIHWPRHFSHIMMRAGIAP